MSLDKASYEHLYEISILDLELSDTAYKALIRTGMTSIGDCIDFYIRLNDVLISARPSFIKAMAVEVKQKVQDFGYWSFVEQHTSS